MKKITRRQFMKTVSACAVSAGAMSLMSACGASSSVAASTAASAAASSVAVQDVALKVWSPEAEADITKQLCDQFAGNHPEYNMTFEYEMVENADSITNLKNDPEAAADIFVFPSGGVAECVEAGLIYPITVDIDNVKTLYGENALKACSKDGEVYGIPQTPNCFFMFYNKSYYSEDEVKSLETMMAKDFDADCYNFSFTIANSWYMESFFYGAGCTLYGADGTDPTECSWNDATGLKVGKYLIDLAKNPKYLEDVDSIAGSKFDEGKCGAVCSGTWSADEFQKALGDNYAAAVLPTFQLDGKECQMSNFSDYKAYGVKASTQAPKAAQELAEWLGGEDAQLLRFQQLSMAPTVTALLENEEVEANPAVCALAEMADSYATPQPTTSQISAYWDPATAFGKGVVNGDVTEANLQQNLDAMVEGMTSKITG
ncbi:MAG: extracellular solute-binding protein [Faecalibacterium sp.]|jgi:arabinogalactan oligomer/maltooligosaccharide transport system substrate-binding protein|nr:extracellular solute-binding protein [Faecalibacterium sp.]